MQDGLTERPEAALPSLVPDTPGAMIERIGLSAASPGDLSDPGLVVKVRERADCRARRAGLNI